MNDLEMQIGVDIGAPEGDETAICLRVGKKNHIIPSPFAAKGAAKLIDNTSQWQKYQDWHEDFGDCLFASTEDDGKIIDEAYFGSPLCSSWPWEYGPNDHLIWMSLPQPPEEKP